jgi:hypothetical protein
MPSCVTIDMKLSPPVAHVPYTGTPLRRGRTLCVDENHANEHHVTGHPAPQKRETRCYGFNSTDQSWSKGGDVSGSRMVETSDGAIAVQVWARCVSTDPSRAIHLRPAVFAHESVIGLSRFVVGFVEARAV